MQGPFIVLGNTWVVHLVRLVMHENCKDLSFLFIRNARKMHGKCMGDVWEIHGKCVILTFLLHKFTRKKYILK